MHKYVDKVVEALLKFELRRATKFVSPTHVVTAHRITYGGRIDRRDKSIDIRLKIGKPNFHERKIIKDCIAAGEPFPVRKIRFAHFRPRPKKRKKR